MKRSLAFLLALLLLLNPLFSAAGTSWLAYAETASPLSLSPAASSTATMILGSDKGFSFRVENPSEANLYNLSLRLEIGNGLMAKAGISLEGVEGQVLPLADGAASYSTEIEFIDMKDLAAGESFSVSIPLESMVYPMVQSEGGWVEGQTPLAFGERVPVTVTWMAGTNPQAVPGVEGASLESQAATLQVEMTPVEVTFTGGGELLKGAGESYAAGDNAFEKSLSIVMKNNEAVPSTVDLKVAVPNGLEVSGFSQNPLGYEEPLAGDLTMNLVGTDGTAFLDFGEQTLAPGQTKTITFNAAVFNKWMVDGMANAGGLINHMQTLPLDLTWTLLSPDLDEDESTQPAYELGQAITAMELILAQQVSSEDDPIGYGSQLDYEITLSSNQYYGSKDVIIHSYLEGVNHHERIGQDVIPFSVWMTMDGIGGYSMIYDGELPNWTGIHWDLMGNDYDMNGWDIDKEAVVTARFSTMVREDWLDPVDGSVISAVAAGDRLVNHATLDMRTAGGELLTDSARVSVGKQIPIASINEGILAVNGSESFETVGDQAVIQVGDQVTMEVVYDGGQIHAKQDIKEMAFYLPLGTSYVEESLSAELISGGPAPAMTYDPALSAFVMAAMPDPVSPGDFLPVQVDEYSKVKYTYVFEVEDSPVIVEGKEDHHLSKLVLQTQANVQSDRDESQFYYSAPRFSLDKSAAETDLANLKGGQVIPFEIVIENDSRSSAYQVVVEDQLPDQLILDPDSLTFTGANVSMVVDQGGLVAFEIDQVPGLTEAGNGRVAIGYEAAVVNPAPAELQFANAAELVSYQKQAGAEAPVYTDQPVQDSVDMTIAPFTISKQVVYNTYAIGEEPVLNKARPGDSLYYEVTITMAEGTEAYDLRLVDTLPLGMELIQATQGEMPCEPAFDEDNPQTFTVAIHDPEFDPIQAMQGERVFTFTILATLKTDQTYGNLDNKTNTAHVTWNTAAGNGAKSKKDAATVQVIIPNVRPLAFLADRTITEADNHHHVTFDPTVADTATFTARFKNKGSDAAHDTALRIDLPPDYALTSTPEGWTYVEADHVLTRTEAIWAAGEVKTWDLALTSNPGAVTSASERLLKATVDAFENIYGKVYDDDRSASIYLNQAPTAQDDRRSTPEDTLLTGQLEHGDLNGDALAYSVLSGNADDVGTLTFTDGAKWSFVPAANYNGDGNAFIVQVSDGLGGLATAALVIDITDVNDRPTLKSTTFETHEESRLSGQLAKTDVDSDGWEYALVEDVGTGTLTLREDGSFDYDPPVDFYGEVTFKARVTDNGDGDDETRLSHEAVLTILVKNVQDAPVLTGDEKNTPEDTPVSGRVTAADPDPEDILSYAVETEPEHGSVTLVKTANGTAAYTYTPDRDYHGTDRFQVRVSDGNDHADVEYVNITVTPVNDAPVIGDQDFETKEDTMISASLVASDVDSEDLKFTIKQNVSQTEGALSLNEDGTFSFTPAKDFVGDVTFQVTVSDQEDPARTDYAVITIAVTPVNDPPVAADLWITLAEDTATDGSVTASDVDGDQLTYTLKAESLEGLRGTVTKTGGSSAPSFTYEPKADDYGTESFVMIVTDGKGGQAEATVTLQVTAVNDLPVTPNQAQAMREDGGEISGKLEISDADPTDILVSSLSREPLHGTAKVATSGAWTYEPDPNWFGTETFDIRTDDGQEGSAVATVTITVESVNDQPITVDYSHATSVNLPVSGQVVAKDADTLNHLFDERDDQLSFSVIKNAEKGRATMASSTGQWRYVPDEGFTGLDSFAILVEDGHGGLAQSEIEIMVIGRDGSIYPSDNEPPITGNQSIVITESDQGTTLFGQVIGTDPNGDDLAYSLLESTEAVLAMPGLGSFALLNERDGQWELDLDDQVDFDQLPSFVSVMMDDGRGGQAVARVYLTKETPVFGLNGVVRDIESHGREATAEDLIAGAMVRLFDAAGDLVGETTSGADGSFAFGDQEEGIYSLEIEKEGFAPKGHEFVFSGDGSEIIYLSPYGLGLVASPKTLVMDGRSVADLMASLTDLEGNPVEGWTITFEPVEEGETAYGTYPDGNTGITDALGQAVQAFRTNDLDFLDSQVVPLVVKASTEADLKAMDQIILIFEPSMIEGIVTDQATGQPVAGALVAIEEDLDGDGLPDYWAEVVTGQDGRYAIPIPFGNSRYALSVTKPMEINGEFQAFTFVQQVDVGDLSGTGESFHGDHTINGILVERDAAGMEGIPNDLSRYALEVMDAEGRIHSDAYAVLHADGSFTVNGVEANERYWIKPRVEFDGQVLYLPGIEVVVSQDGEMSIAQVLVDPFGTVTDKSTGEAIEGAEVTLYYADTERNRAAGRPIDQPVVLPDHPLALSNNENPQYTTVEGQYGYMVYPFTDYYLLVGADGYKDFDSRDDRIISVEEAIVIYDIEMSRLGGRPTPVEGGLEMSLRAQSKTPRVEAGAEAQIELTATNLSDQVISEVAIRSALPDGISPVIPAYTEGMRIRIVGDELVITLYNAAPGQRVVIPLAYRTRDDEANGRVVRMEYGITPLYGIKRTDQLNAQAGFLIIQPGQVGSHDRYLYGYPDETVQPERFVSRAEATAMVVRILKLDDGSSVETVFDAELEGHWARDNIAAAVKRGLIEGYLTGWFKPDRAMTRAEFSTLVARTIDLDRSGDARAFWADNTMDRLMDYGLIKGDPDGSLRPDDPISRAEAVTILNRLLMRGPLSGIEPFYIDLDSSHWAYGDLIEATYNHDFVYEENGERVKDHDLEKPISE